jgi:hypothetical protein
MSHTFFPIVSLKVSKSKSWWKYCCCDKIVLGRFATSCTGSTSASIFGPNSRNYNRRFVVWYGGRKREREKEEGGGRREKKNRTVSLRRRRNCD